ncbi:hypothetical protein DFH11DRAFT_1549449 [Phellopilus nigrolimitatus]|nr:hypothetical protein DFH11DRAFT_1549449 [Phellopilus nigrolimitatus]
MARKTDMDFAFEASTIGNLFDVLQKLQGLSKSGPIVAEKLWLWLHLRNMQELLFSLRRRVRSQDYRVRKSAEKASYSSWFRLTSRRRPCGDSGIGMRREKVVKERHGCENSVSLSHVSRRFRTVALSLPRLWSHVSDIQGLEEIQTFLMRSKKTGLSIELGHCLKPEGGGYLTFTDFLQNVADHSGRWRELTLSFPLWGADAFDNALAHCPCLHSLRFLSVGFSTNDEAVDLWDLDEIIQELFGAWHTPNIVELQARVIPNESFGTTLRKCKFDLDEDVVPEIYRLPLFLDQKRLTHLHISFRGFFEDDLEVAPFRLPCLLYLTFEISESCPDIIAGLMKKLISPRLSSLSLEILDDVQVNDGQIWLETLLGRECLVSLQKFSIVMDVSEEAIGTISFHALLEGLPNIRHLSIEASNQSLIFSERSELGSYDLPHLHLPHLRTLCLKNCRHLEESALKGLFDIGGFADKWKHFKRLEIADCPLLTRRGVSSIVPPRKISWKK